MKSPGYTPEQVKSMVDKDGNELFARMYEDNEMVENGHPDAPPLGKWYYDDLRKQFGPAVDSCQNLKVLGQH